jgi:hypothetical protein
MLIKGAHVLTVDPELGDIVIPEEALERKKAAEAQA